MKTSLMKYFFFIPLLLIKAQMAEWNIIGQMPHPVIGGNAVVHNEKIYILGGYSDSLQSEVDWIQSFNPETKEWKFESRMNIPRSYFAAGVNSQGVYYAGGSGQFLSGTNANEYIEFWNFDVGNSPTLFLRSPLFYRNFVNGEIDESDFYLIGGIPLYPANYSNSIILKQSLTSVENNVTEFFIGDSTDILLDNMTAILNNNIFIIGGYLKGISQKVIAFNKKLVFIDTLTTTLKVPRALGEAVPIPEKNEIYVLGGQNEFSYALNSVEIIKFSKNEISNKVASPLNKARSGFMSVLYNGRIYVFGGANENGFEVPEIEVLDVITDIQQASPIISDIFKLEQNYPNPFNPTTTIEYSIPNGTDYNLMQKNITIKVYDVLGKKIATLVNEEQSPGTYKIVFDGSKLPSGIYFYTLNSGSFFETKSMLLLK